VGGVATRFIVTHYGCYNREIEKGYYAPARLYRANGSFVMCAKYILHRMSTDCKYDKSATDPRCAGCKHIKPGATE
jgi:hypothetical protein